MKFALTAFAFISLAGFAGDFPQEETLFIDNVTMNGRTIVHSCSNFSNAETELEVEFLSGPVDYGTRVFIEFGWGGSDQSTGKTFEWAQKNELELERKTPMTWKGNLTQTIAQRSSPVRILDLNFVFRVQEPGKPARYVGGVKSGNTFVAHLPKVEDSTCVNPGDAYPDFSELVVQIERN
ncbi:MAG: hypothetical protein EBQ92_07075 [Proteobacteria bacterium]|jgi:hypothetical protein|nr:hypothetical protein [Pseudomonadota bacterium]